MVRSIALSVLLMAWAPLAVLAQPAPVAGVPAIDAPSSTDTRAITSIDISSAIANQEAVTILAKRPSHSWRSTLARIPDQQPTRAPLGLPEHSFVPPHAYCNSALRTVGGQPASEAETMAGLGAGSC